MSDKSSAIDDVKSGHAELLKAIEGLPDDKMGVVWYGEWSTKDVLAHIASWDEFATLDLRRIGRGHIPCLAAFKEAEVDEWNGFFMRPRKLFALPQVRFEGEHWHDELLDTLDALPDPMFSQGQMVANFVAIAGAHYRDHAGRITEWRQKEGV
jgi:hypothetical protein